MAPPGGRLGRPYSLPRGHQALHARTRTPNGTPLVPRRRVEDVGRAVVDRRPVGRERCYAVRRHSPRAARPRVRRRTGLHDPALQPPRGAAAEEARQVTHAGLGLHFSSADGPDYLQGAWARRLRRGGDISLPGRGDACPYKRRVRLGGRPMKAGESRNRSELTTASAPDPRGIAMPARLCSKGDQSWSIRWNGSGWPHLPSTIQR